MEYRIRVKWEMDGDLFKAEYEQYTLEIKRTGSEFFWCIYKDGAIVDCVFYYKYFIKSDGQAKVKAESALFRAVYEI